MNSIHGFEAKDIQGKMRSLKEYEGKVLLIVNTASECGFTPQYKELEELYKKYTSRGFEVLGFPCNQFGGQEPGDDPTIATFCERNFGVTFPLFAKVDVNGAHSHPLWEFLKKNAPGILGTEAIKWNFTKFLVDKKGVVIDRFAPNTHPSKIGPEIEKLF